MSVLKAMSHVLFLVVLTLVFDWMTGWHTDKVDIAIIIGSVALMRTYDKARGEA